MQIEAKSDKTLRKFGITISIPLALLGGVLWWKDAPTFVPVLSVAGGLFILAVLLPRSLKYIEWVWMKIALVMSYIMTRVILTIAFIFVISPFGILLRLMGKDLLQLKIDRNKVSYWDPVEVDGPQTRPDKPF